MHMDIRCILEPGKEAGHQALMMHPFDGSCRTAQYSRLGLSESARTFTYELLRYQDRIYYPHVPLGQKTLNCFHAVFLSE
ncbi:hypothetical protein [Nonomuraea sp. KM90]|uniref:hypothetical protein n=1 Tax=Nonomuraea sp. KM90 TaxID=3457428 RepID=UPI003FCC9119